ncbi:piwi-like protein Siwi [Nasonia vitripennis]|uniref:Uncharacterized protein n=1 Tax=Nasonia vitripennis TaxID=7425 RepID=A0A7M7G732_NASVI|nr:piwi-like protein Siwi [Nasonia vitripennis]
MAAAVGGRRSRAPPTNEVKTKPLHVTSKLGTTGRKVVLNANYFKLKSKTDWCLYQYRVDIAPDEERTIVRKSLLRTHKAALGAYLFDGTVLYTSNRLPNPMELNSIRQEDKKPMSIKIRLVGDVVKGDYHYFQFFNIMVRKCLENLNLQLVGRNYFDAAAKVEITQYRLELWPGYVTSIRQHERDVLMCAEISHKVMRNQTVYDILRDTHEKHRSEYQNKFSSTVIGSVVLTDYNNRTYKVDDVDYTKSPSSTFKLRDGTDISYATYYQQKYQVRIRDPKQPLLVSRSKARDRRAGNDELVYLIPELCRSTGLTDEMRGNFQLMRALAEHTRIAPEARMRRLLAFNNRLRSKPEVIQDFKEWNFDLESNLVELPGRVLPMETIYFGSKKVLLKQADWTVDVQDAVPVSCRPLKDWVAIVPNKSSESAKAFIELIITVASKMKFAISRPRLVMIDNDKSETVAQTITAITDKSVPQLIFCVVFNNNLLRYQAIKKKLCLDRPIPSQVVMSRTLVQKTPANTRSVATKVAVQLNCKMGGVPWTTDIGQILPGLMVVGFDVCHDKNGDFGALVASLDQNFARYYSAVSVHAAGEELSNHFAQLLGNAVMEFYKVNKNRLPSKIIIYRDGVGEGQLPFVYDYEVTQVRDSLSKIYARPEHIKLAFIIVTKRLNTRFFLNKNNPPAGTVIDDVITDPLKYDFFIVSQAVRQGTVAPTAYNVLQDSTGLKADQMQRLTYKLCHMYYNFSGTVRVPAPCQYAHKLAFFVSQTIKQPAHPQLSTTLYFL